MRYLVTGAEGFVGARVTARLRADGHRVRAERSVPGEDALHAATRGVDGVFHLAVHDAPGAPDDEAAAINVEGTRRVLGAARAAGVPRSVVASSLVVNGDTRGQLVDEHHRYDGPLASAHARTLRRALREVVEPATAAGLPIVVLLHGLVYGPGDPGALGATLRRYLRGELPALPRDTAYCWAHVDDVADAHVAAMGAARDGERYIVAGPMYTVVGAFDIAERITGIPAPALRVAPAMLRMAAAMLGAADDEEAPPPRWGRVTPAARWGSSQLGNDAKARRELGFDPRPLEAGLRVTLAAERLAAGPQL